MFKMNLLTAALVSMAVGSLTRDVYTAGLFGCATLAAMNTIVGAINAKAESPVLGPHGSPARSPINQGSPPNVDELMARRDGGGGNG